MTYEEAMQLKDKLLVSLDDLEIGDTVWIMDSKSNINTRTKKTIKIDGEEWYRWESPMFTYTITEMKYAGRLKTHFEQSNLDPKIVKFLLEEYEDPLEDVYLMTPANGSVMSDMWASQLWNASTDKKTIVEIMDALNNKYD